MKSAGFTFIDLLIGMAMTSIIALIAMNLLLTNMKVTSQHTGHSSAAADAQQLFRVISEFVKQAEICSTCVPDKTLDITYLGASNPNSAGTLSLDNDDIQIDFLLPSGYKVWPNDTAPYTSPAVRLSWDNATGIASIRNAADKANLSAVTAQNLVSVTGRASRVVNIDLWPLAVGGVRQASTNALPDGGYELCVGVKPPSPDSNYVNPDDTGSLLHYRTAKVCGIVFPRNW